MGPSRPFAFSSGGILFLVLVLFLLGASHRLGGQEVYTLHDCINIALQHNRDVKVAKLRIRSALSEKKGALSAILPTLSYTEGYSNQGSYSNPQFGIPIPKSEFHSAGLYVNQNIFDGGKWWNQISSARNSFELGVQSERNTEVTVVLQVKKAFYQYLKDLQLLEVAKQSVDLAEQQVELVKHQYEVEAVARSDLLKQEVRLGEMRVEYLNQRTAVKNSFNQLANVMGLGLDSRFEVVDPSSVKPLDVLLEEMAKDNLALAAKRAQITGSQLRVKIARAGYLPTLSASLSYDGFADIFDDLYADLDKNWRRQFRLSVSYPLFTGLSQSSQVEKAKVEHRIQQEEYHGLENDLRVQLDMTLRQLGNLKEMIPIFEETKKAADEDLRLARERYNLGAATILDVLDAQVSVARANSSLVRAIYDEKILRAELDALMGKM
ncbi:MAG: TolC family protein, partial [Fidelibacterota bacterium]